MNTSPVSLRRVGYILVCLGSGRFVVDVGQFVDFVTEGHVVDERHAGTGVRPVEELGEQDAEVSLRQISTQIQLLVQHPLELLPRHRPLVQLVKVSERREQLHPCWQHLKRVKYVINK